jgi:hypothetical protein
MTMARTSPQPRPLMLSDLARLAARHAAEIEEIARNELPDDRASTMGLVLMMTVSALREKGLPAVGVTYVPVPAK